MFVDVCVAVEVIVHQPQKKRKKKRATRALSSCCAIARTQHLGQRNRFVQQSPRGWLRATQHAIVGAQHFSRLVALFLFAAGNFFVWGSFFLNRSGRSFRYLVLVTWFSLLGFRYLVFVNWFSGVCSRIYRNFFCTQQTPNH